MLRRRAGVALVRALERGGENRAEASSAHTKAKAEAKSKTKGNGEDGGLKASATKTEVANWDAGNGIYETT
jgi:hypothetical protein